MTEVFEQFYDRLVMVLDIPLGWMLYCGRDLPLVLLAAGTAFAMLLLRKRVSDQEFLGRCAGDRDTLRRRIREAKKAGDKELLQKLRAAAARVSLKMMRREGRPLLVSLLPIMLLAAWAYARLGHYPPQSSVPIAVSADFDPVLAGTVVYMLPEAGVTATGGWVQIAENVELAGGEAVARAEWLLVFAGRKEPYLLTVRGGGESADLSVILDRRTYRVPERFYPGVITAVRIHLAERRFLGILPGIEKLMIPPWMLAYLLLAVPFYLLFKKILRVH